MPRISEKDRCQADQKSMARSSMNVYQPWEEEYSCDMLEQYYYGKQWQGDDQQWDKRKYVINLIYSALNISKPSLLFQVPKYTVTPRLTRVDDPMSDVETRAKLQEDVLNTFAQDPKLGYLVEAGLALLDSQFRFAWVEIGYTADYIDNPNADKPIMVDGPEGPEPMRDKAGNEVSQAKFTIKSEGLYMKWIPAKQCRTSERNGNRLTNCDWVGYYEWWYVDDIKKHPGFKNTDKLSATGRIKGHKDEGAVVGEDRHPGMMKVWKKWDLRAKGRRIFGEGAEKYFKEEPFSFLPIADLKFHEILGQYLPLPPTYNWVHPQNQLNDIREMRRLHRKRAIRRYLQRSGALEAEELAKLMEDEDMTVVTVNSTGDPSTAIVPMTDAPLDPAIFRDEASTLDDFTRITGVSGESQQVAESETATQANLIALMGQVRENARRTQVALFLGEIGRLMLLTIKDKMTLPMWIKKVVDPYSPMAAMEAQEVAKLWYQITAQEIGDVDNDIRVDISSMSPVQQAQERTDWLGFLTLLVSPGVSTMLMASPFLMRKTAALFNIHSERDLVEVSKAVTMMAMMAVQSAQPAKPNGAGGASPGPTPSNNDIVGQLQAQLPVETLQ